MLYTDLLEAAGTADCIAEFDGVLSVIDFKTSRKWKSKDWISNYFQQCTFYALAARERINLNINQIVVLISVDNEEPLVYKESVIDWIKSTKQCRDNFRLDTGL
jgi:genome maintenance exonuclease 1